MLACIILPFCRTSATPVETTIPASAVGFGGREEPPFVDSWKEGEGDTRLILVYRSVGLPLDSAVADGVIARSAFLDPPMA